MARGARRKRIATEIGSAPTIGVSLADLPALTAEPAVPYLLPDGPLNVILVGCGGTGSQLADVLAKIVTQAREERLAEPRLALVDGDESVDQKLDPARQTYVHVARGEVEVNGQKLGAGDAAMLSRETQLNLRAGKEAVVLTFDLP